MNSLWSLLTGGFSSNSVHNLYIIVQVEDLRCAWGALHDSVNVQAETGGAIAASNKKL